MDNFEVSIVADSRRGPIQKALEIIFEHTPGKHATHYAQVVQPAEPGKGYPTLFLYWSDPSLTDAQKLPFAMDSVDALPFVSSWLRQAKLPPDSRPDIDGSAEPTAVRITTKRYRGGGPYLICCIQPEWAWFGK